MIWQQWVGLVLLILSLSAQSRTPPETTTWEGVVTYVVDGDTVHVRPVDGGKVHKIRIIGMDAPEICQTGGVAARQALLELVFQRYVTVSARGVDDYGRDLATIYLNMEDVGHWMVQRGHAWSYRFKRDPGPYVQEEESAKLLGKGVFAEVPAEYPRDFRRRYGRCPYRR